MKEGQLLTSMDATSILARLDSLESKVDVIDVNVAAILALLKNNGNLQQQQVPTPPPPPQAVVQGSPTQSSVQTSENIVEKESTTPKESLATSDEPKSHLAQTAEIRTFSNRRKKRLENSPDLKRQPSANEISTPEISEAEPTTTSTTTTATEDTNHKPNGKSHSKKSKSHKPSSTSSSSSQQPSSSSPPSSPPPSLPFSFNSVVPPPLEQLNFPTLMDAPINITPSSLRSRGKSPATPATPPPDPPTTPQPANSSRKSAKKTHARIEGPTIAPEFASSTRLRNSHSSKFEFEDPPDVAVGRKKRPKPDLPPISSPHPAPIATPTSPPTSTPSPPSSTSPSKGPSSPSRQLPHSNHVSLVSPKQESESNKRKWDDNDQVVLLAYDSDDDKRSPPKNSKIPVVSTPPNKSPRLQQSNGRTTRSSSKHTEDIITEPMKPDLPESPPQRARKSSRHYASPATTPKASPFSSPSQSNNTSPVSSPRSTPTSTKSHCTAATTDISSPSSAAKSASTSPVSSPHSNGAHPSPPKKSSNSPVSSPSSNGTQPTPKESPTKQSSTSLVNPPQTTSPPLNSSSTTSASPRTYNLRSHSLAAPTLNFTPTASTDSSPQRPTISIPVLNFTPTTPPTNNNNNGTSQTVPNLSSRNSNPPSPSPSPPLAPSLSSPKSAPSSPLQSPTTPTRSPKLSLNFLCNKEEPTLMEYRFALLAPTFAKFVEAEDDLSLQYLPSKDSEITSSALLEQEKCFCDSCLTSIPDRYWTFSEEPLQSTEAKNLREWDAIEAGLVKKELLRLQKRAHEQKTANKISTCHRCKAVKQDMYSCSCGRRFCNYCLTVHDMTIAMTKEPGWECPYCTTACNCKICRDEAAEAYQYEGSLTFDLCLQCGQRWHTSDRRMGYTPFISKQTKKTTPTKQKKKNKQKTPTKTQQEPLDDCPLNESKITLKIAMKYMVLRRIIAHDQFVNVIQRFEKLRKRIPSEPVQDSSGLPLATRSIEAVELSWFQTNWKRGVPVVVHGCKKRLKLKWSPDEFMSKCGDEVPDMIDCRDKTSVDQVSVAEFFGGYLNEADRSLDQDGFPMKLKLKDWPAKEDFAKKLPEYFDDLMQALPFSDYVKPDGSLNMVSALPASANKTDLGPKCYIAYEDTSTSLHFDMSDAVNLLVDVSHTTTTAPGVDSSKASDPKCGALWHIFRREDSEKLSNYLTSSKGKSSKQGHTIFDHSVYVTDEDLAALKKIGVIPHYIYQLEGDAVFIPAGCPHQVLNVRCCIKVAEDFVSPENLEHCINLTDEFRKLPITHIFRKDRLQVRTILYHAVESTVKQLDV